MSTIQLLYCLYLNITLFVLGLLGVILNKKNIMITLMSIEILLLSVSLNFITGSAFFNDVIGEIFVIFILAIAASESAIVLAIIISICRYRGSMETVLLKKTRHTEQLLTFKS